MTFYERMSEVTYWRSCIVDQMIVIWMMQYWNEIIDEDERDGNIANISSL